MDWLLTLIVIVSIMGVGLVAASTVVVVVLSLMAIKILKEKDDLIDERRSVFGASRQKPESVI